jgi:hypothetical protein
VGCAWLWAVGVLLAAALLSVGLLAVRISDELRRLLGHVGLQLPPVYLRLVAPITDSKALALLPLQVRKDQCDALNRVLHQRGLRMALGRWCAAYTAAVLLAVWQPCLVCVCVCLVLLSMCIGCLLESAWKRLPRYVLVSFSHRPYCLS